MPTLLLCKGWALSETRAGVDWWSDEPAVATSQCWRDEGCMARSREKEVRCSRRDLQSSPLQSNDHQPLPPNTETVRTAHLLHREGKNPPNKRALVANEQGRPFARLSPRGFADWESRRPPDAEPKFKLHSRITFPHCVNTSLSPNTTVRPNDRVERPATMTVPRQDAAHDVPRTAPTRC